MHNDLTADRTIDVCLHVAVYFLSWAPVPCFSIFLIAAAFGSSLITSTKMLAPLLYSLVRISITIVFIDTIYSRFLPIYGPELKFRPSPIRA
jgi:hypothetical protein